MLGDVGSDVTLGNAILGHLMRNCKLLGIGIAVRPKQDAFDPIIYFNACFDVCHL